MLKYNNTQASTCLVISSSLGDYLGLHRAQFLLGGILKYRLHCPLFSTMRKCERSSWVLLLVDRTDSKTAFFYLINSVYFWTYGCLSATEAIKASICKILLTT